MLFQLQPMVTLRYVPPRASIRSRTDYWNKIGHPQTTVFEAAPPIRNLPSIHPRPLRSSVGILISRPLAEQALHHKEQPNLGCV
jgi:hypothetical protein